MSGGGTTDTRATGSFRARVNRWLDSDLVGIAATLYGFAVLVLAFLVFRVGGGVAGMIVIVAAWIPMVLFAIQGRGKPPGRLEVTVPEEGPLHRVLVIANQGLEDPALCAEVCRRSDRTSTEAMILAPVVASSPLAELSDDVDREMGVARRRLDAALQSLRGEGVKANGRADIANPMESLLDGLREFPPNEILMLPDREARWDSATDLAERVRAEVGLPVTAIGPSRATSNSESA
ncbi:MAG TPA: hypothetical protein VFZ41_05625 [Solirubrobacterales bacterium]